MDHALVKHLERIDERLGTWDDDESLKDRVIALETRISGLEQHIQSLQDENLELRALIRQTGPYQKELNSAEVSRIWNKLGELREDLKWLSKNHTIINIEKRLDELEDHPAVAIPPIGVL